MAGIFGNKTIFLIIQKKNTQTYIIRMFIETVYPNNIQSNN
jgi:hypothetical protein